jgi:hypothetical protein
MSLFISSVFTYDEDAGNYIQAVETADAQALEPATRKAINDFVIGCKQDGIWTAIKASCILSGARTLAGALQPLVGTAPTNNGFVGIGTDYVRKTGLVGDGSTKYLDSNRAGNADPQNNQHISIFMSSAPLTNSTRYVIDSGFSSAGTSAILTSGSGTFVKSQNSTADILSSSKQTGFHGVARSVSASYTARVTGKTTLFSRVSQTPISQEFLLYSSANGTRADARLAFYSIGEAIDLALLDARITDLINAFAVTIP